MTPHREPAGPSLDAQRWQDSWDRQQEAYLPDREDRLGYLIALARAARTGSPCVLDLACGTASITRRLLAADPQARAVALDVDPVLLRIARAGLAGQPGARVARADLRDPGWTAGLADTRFDAVLTATALHWLGEDVLRRLYRDLAGLLGPGAVFANADHMPLAGAPALADLARAARGPAGGDAWARWWDEVAREPAFGPDLAARAGVFPDQHPPEFTPAADWHVAALREAGFAEAATLWRRGGDAIVAAVR